MYFVQANEFDVEDFLKNIPATKLVRIVQGSLSEKVN